MIRANKEASKLNPESRPTVFNRPGKKTYNNGAITSYDLDPYKEGKLPKYEDQKIAFPIAPKIAVPNLMSDNHISPYKQLFSGLNDTEKRNVLGYTIEPQLS